jgi:hypothetical protein
MGKIDNVLCFIEYRYHSYYLLKMLSQDKTVVILHYLSINHIILSFKDIVNINYVYISILENRFILRIILIII